MATPRFALPARPSRSGSSPILALGAALGLLLVVLAVTPLRAAPGARFEVYHYDSAVQGEAFQEVFRVHATHGDAIATANVTVLRDGEPLQVAWQDVDGLVSPGDRFAFVAEAFDTQHVLEAHAGGRQVMECRYGGGAGHRVEPEAAARHGLLRCLFEDQE